MKKESKVDLFEYSCDTSSIPELIGRVPDLYKWPIIPFVIIDGKEVAEVNIDKFYKNKKKQMLNNK